MSQMRCGKPYTCFTNANVQIALTAEHRYNCMLAAVEYLVSVEVVVPLPLDQLPSLLILHDCCDAAHTPGA